MARNLINQWLLMSHGWVAAGESWLKAGWPLMSHGWVAADGSRVKFFHSNKFLTMRRYTKM